VSNSDDGTWYELRPNGHPSIGVWNSPRYRDRESAELAARQMRERSPDYKFVEIVSYECKDGERSRPAPVGRV
jgi:hypothetical protein